MQVVTACIWSALSTKHTVFVVQVLFGQYEAQISHG